MGLEMDAAWKERVRGDRLPATRRRQSRTRASSRIAPSTSTAMLTPATPSSSMRVARARRCRGLAADDEGREQGRFDAGRRVDGNGRVGHEPGAGGQRGDAEDEDEAVGVHGSRSCSGSRPGWRSDSRVASGGAVSGAAWAAASRLRRHRQRCPTSRRSCVRSFRPSSWACTRRSSSNGSAVGDGNLEPAGGVRRRHWQERHVMPFECGDDVLRVEAARAGAGRVPCVVLQPHLPDGHGARVEARGVLFEESTLRIPEAAERSHQVEEIGRVEENTHEPLSVLRLQTEHASAERRIVELLRPALSVAFDAELSEGLGQLLEVEAPAAGGSARAPRRGRRAS